MTGGGHVGEVPTEDPQREVVTLVPDVGARRAVEADGIPDRGQHDVSQLTQRELDEADAPQQLHAHEAGIVDDGLAGIGGEPDGRLTGTRPRRSVDGDAARREDTVVRARCFGEHAAIRRLGGGEAGRLLANAAGPVEGRYAKRTTAGNLPDADPRLLGAGKIATQIRDPTQAPQRQAGDVARIGVAADSFVDARHACGGGVGFICCAEGDGVNGVERAMQPCCR